MSCIKGCISIFILDAPRKLLSTQKELNWIIEQKDSIDPVFSEGRDGGLSIMIYSSGPGKALQDVNSFNFLKDKTKSFLASDTFIKSVRPGQNLDGLLRALPLGQNNIEFMSEFPIRDFESTPLFSIDPPKKKKTVKVNNPINQTTVDYEESYSPGAGYYEEHHPHVVDYIQKDEQEEEDEDDWKGPKTQDVF